MPVTTNETGTAGGALYQNLERCVSSSDSRANQGDGSSIGYVSWDGDACCRNSARDGRPTQLVHIFDTLKPLLLAVNNTQNTLHHLEVAKRQNESERWFRESSKWDILKEKIVSGIYWRV
jgi:hypothetical protein